MISQDKKNLYVFGYGIALFIPFLICLQILKHGLNFGPFVFVLLGGFVVLLTIIARIASWKPLYNIWILLAQLNVAILKIVYGTGFLAMIFVGLAVAFLIITLIKVDLLKSPYTVWMKVTGVIGMVISTLLLAIIFYFVFTPVGLLLRILRKDLLDRAIELEKESYWIKREGVPPQDSYKNQF